MKTKIENQAVKDLFKSMARPLRRKREILESIRDNLDLIETGCISTVIEKVIADGAKRYLWLKEKGEQNYEHEVVLACLEELDFYSDKRKFLDIVIAKFKQIEAAIERLKELQPIVRDIFANLDPRIKALFRIYETLVDVDDFNETEYQHYLYDYNLFGDASINCLKNEAAFTPAIEAVKLANEVLEMIR